MFKTIQILCIGLIASFILSACGKKEDPLKMVEPAAPPAEAVLAPTAIADSIPAISNGVEYPAFRKMLIGSGWIPNKQTNECGFNCQGKRRDGLIETQDCADAGIAPCVFVFKNEESEILKVYTVGENLSVEKTEGGGGSTSAAIDKQKMQPANDQTSSSKEINPTTYMKALNSSFGPTGWAECIKGSVTVMAVSIKYNQTLSADIQKVMGVVEDTLGAMRKQMLVDGVSEGTLDSLIRSQPSLANGDQALKVVGGCYQRMEKILYSLK